MYCIKLWKHLLKTVHLYLVRVHKPILIKLIASFIPFMNSFNLGPLILFIESIFDSISIVEQFSVLSRLNHSHLIVVLFNSGAG